MPMQREKYPDNWEELAMFAKWLVGWRCANPSCRRQCRRPGEPHQTHQRTLTVAHLDHDPQNPAARLLPLCAPCHLAHDERHHVQTRRTKRFVNQFDLFAI